MRFNQMFRCIEENMGNFVNLFDADMLRYGDKGAKGWTRKFLLYFRKVSTCDNKVLWWYYRVRYYYVCQKRGIEIPWNTRVGKGFYVGHAYNITINEEAEIGDNVNIHKGVTIGRENRGIRKGVPKIGNCVYIGINSTVVGNITVGDDVLIAPNTLVNCDVPSHSIVIGCPCKIVAREHATEMYINRMV